MMHDPQLVEQVSDMLTKSQRSLAAAERLLAAGDSDFAASRAYYAAFYAMSAALLTRGVVRSKHSGVIGSFGQYFIASGPFPGEFGDQINSLFRDRQMGDYRGQVCITEAAARSDIDHARIIVDAIVAHLQREGFQP